MASTVHTDFDTPTAALYLRVRSLSHTSHPGTPTEIPACLNDTGYTHSPSLASPPSNTPESEIDSNLASPSANPSDKVVSLQFHPPDFLKLHHFGVFHSPILWPTVPPNSPENWGIQGETIGKMANADVDVSTSLGERMHALQHARNGKGGFSDSEVKILKEETPKAPDNVPYSIRAIPGKGYGCFALQPIKRGTRILADSPLLIVPIGQYYAAHVQEAFSKLSPDDQALYFTLHSAHGQDPNNWPKHIHSSVSEHDRRRIEEQHHARVAKEPSLVSIFQTNCMEKDGGAAVFPYAARFNHSCNPNACFSWNYNPAIQKEVIHAMRDIEQGEQITLSYCSMSHDKATRKWELKHYGFTCDCPACSGDESDPDSFAAKSAANRFRMMDLDESFKGCRGRYLAMGVLVEGFVERLLEYVKVLIAEGDYTSQLAHAYLDIALVCETKGDLKFAKQASLQALRVKMDSQGLDFPDVKAFREVCVRIKKKMAAEEAEAGSK